MNSLRALVYVNEADKKGRKYVKDNTAKILASYSQAVLVEAEDAQIQTLQRQGYRLEVQEQATMIKLKAVQFDTSSTAPATPAALTLTTTERSSKRKRDFWIVQFVGPLKAEWGQQVKALGIELKDYVPENSFLVEMSAAIADEVKALPFVNWVGVYEPAYKLSPLLMGQKQRAMGDELATRTIDRKSFKSKPEGNLTILVHVDADLKKVARAVKTLGGTIVASEGSTITASLDPELTDQLVKMAEVKWVEPYEPPVLTNDVAAQIIQVQQVWNNTELLGEDQVVAVADTGLSSGVDNNTMHPDFRGRIVAIHDRVNDGAKDANSGHGTHVAGSVLGNGTQSNGTIRGMAPAARLVFQATESNSTGKLTGIPADLNQLFQEAYNDGARIHTNSWGMQAFYGQYLSASEDIDEFMWNHKDCVILFAAGNEGVDSNNDGVINNDSILPQATAKNCITVGATESNRPHGSTPPPGYDFDWGTGWANKFPHIPISNDHVSNKPEGMAAFSGRGPTDDGRPKPDVVAPGTNILSTHAAGSGDGWGRLQPNDPNYDYYKWFGGTSMATPLTAGTVALIRQYIVNVFNHTAPSGALLKAILIHGAVPIRGHPYQPPDVGPVPDTSQGWGRVNLANSLYPAFPATWRFYDDPAVQIGTFEEWNNTFTIWNTTVPLRATLVWTDFPSSPASGGGLVNELRLELVAPNGTTSPGAPAINNVQQVVIANPQAGSYSVRVSGVNVRTQASRFQKQDFALVVSGGMDFVDLYIKDNPADNGMVPTGRPWNQSPDIIPVTDQVRKKLRVAVKVHNRGSKAAAKAKVCLYWASGPNTSPKSWRKNGIRVGGKPGNCQTLDVPGRDAARDGEATTADFELIPSSTAIHDLGRINRYYLIATVSHPDDPLRARTARWDNNVAVKGR